MSGHAIHIKIDGRTYAGTYQVDRKILTVTAPYGRKSAEIAPRVAERHPGPPALAGAGPAGKGPQGLYPLIVRHLDQVAAGCRQHPHCCQDCAEAHFTV
jgi:hypothetical protein